VFKKKAIKKDALLNQILPVSNAVDQYVSKSASNLKSYGKWVLGKRIPYISNEEGVHPLEQNTTKHMFVSIGKYHPEREQKYFEYLCQDLEYPICKEFLHIGADSKYRKDGRDFVFALVRPDQHIVSILKLS
jgi:hypothetical protein